MIVTHPTNYTIIAGWFDRPYNGFKKPNAREVSTAVVRTSAERDDLRHSAMLIHFGQFMAHDITLTRAVN